MSKKVVSFSLWGNHPDYTAGALDSVNQVKSMYPGWECRIYVGRDVSIEIREELCRLGAVLIDGPDWGIWSGMYWRFLAASDLSVEVMISRDVDTKILPREVDAVNQWLSSGRPLHIMRDHPKHEMPIMGGMWGCIARHFRDISSQIEKWNHFSEYGCDQEFLSRVIYPKFRDLSFIHSECIVFKDEEIHPYPSTRNSDEVIGMAIRDEDIVKLQKKYLKEWIDAGSPLLKRPHPWSLPGRIRRLTRGRWPGESL